MIHIVCPNSDSKLGIEAILDIEKIANAAFGPGDAKAPAILFGDGRPPCEIGASSYVRHAANFIQIKRDQIAGIFGEKDRRILKGFCKNEIITLPCSGYLEARSLDRSASVLLRDAAGHVIAVKNGGVIWSGLDIGESTLSLLSERYIFGEARDLKDKRDLASNRTAQEIYYRVPAFVRNKVQRLYYASLEKRLKRRQPASFVTNYPIEMAGWILIRLFISLIMELDGIVVSIGKWRHGFDAAFAFTHDIEPTKFSYRKGLEALLNSIASDDPERHMLDLVAHNALKYIKEQGSISCISRYGIMCHGYYHDGAKLYLPYEKILSRLKNGKDRLERRFAKEVKGYRSPRYERNQYILMGIKEAGYKYSSSCPDVDRGNTNMYGGGVGLNYPFNHFLKDGSGYRRSGLLEMPITSPDCIEPLMMGASVDQMCRMYLEKMRYIEAINGAYVCIVHAGNFDNQDIEVRTDLLSFLMHKVGDFNFWLTNLDEIANWWTERQGLEPTMAGGDLSIRNSCEAEIKDVPVLYERKGDGSAHRSLINIRAYAEEVIKVS